MSDLLEAGGFVLMIDVDSKEIADLFSENFGLNEELLALLLKHLDLVLEKNKDVNITGIIDRQEAILLHLYDSLLGLKQLSLAEPGEFADLGSGAGYPGIPLVVSSGRKGTLIESIAKKAVLLEEFSQELGLSDKLTVVNNRAETLAQEIEEGFTAMCARAVGSLAVLMELAYPLLAINGLLIAYKGPDAVDEIEKAYQNCEMFGMQMFAVDEYIIPYMNAKRVIVVLRKVQNAKMMLPRRVGQAQKRPLF